MAITQKLIGESVGIQFTGTRDETGTNPILGLTDGLIVGQFRRGRTDKPMRITQQNIRAELGYQPNNKFYQAVQNTLDNFLHVDVLRVGEVGSSQEVINATYDNFYQTMTVTGAAGLFVETKDPNGNVIGSGIIGSDGTVTYTLNTAGQLDNAPIYTKSDLSNTVSHFLVIPSNEIPSDEMHFTTLAGSVDYVGTQGDQILLSNGIIIDITATGETVTFNAPSGKHVVRLVESVERSNYVSVGGGALVELHNFPALSTVTKFNFATYNYHASPNLTKVPNFLPSNITNMGFMFVNATSFNQPLNNWNVSNVTDMSGMFASATSFNQDLSMWCVSNIPTMPYNFDLNASNWTLPRPVWGTCPA